MFNHSEVLEKHAEINERDIERAVFAQEQIDYFKDKSLLLSEWQALDGLLTDEKKGVVGCGDMALIRFKKAKRTLIKTLEREAYPNLCNWDHKCSDFQYDVNTIKFWARACQYFGELK